MNTELKIEMRAIETQVKPSDWHCRRLHPNGSDSRVNKTTKQYAQTRAIKTSV